MGARHLVHLTWLPLVWFAARTFWLHLRLGAKHAEIVAPAAALVLLLIALFVWAVSLRRLKVWFGIPLAVVLVGLAGIGGVAAEHGALAAGAPGYIPLFVDRDDTEAWVGEDCFAHLGGTTPRQYDVYITSDAGKPLSMHLDAVARSVDQAFAGLPMVLHTGPPPSDPAGRADAIHVNLLFNHRIVDGVALAGQYCASHVQVVATSPAATGATVVHEIGHHFGLSHSEGGYMVGTQQRGPAPENWTPEQEKHLLDWAVPDVPIPIPLL